MHAYLVAADCKRFSQLRWSKGDSQSHWQKKKKCIPQLLISFTRDNSQLSPSWHATMVYLSFDSLFLSICLDMRLEKQTYFIIQTRQPLFVSAETWTTLSECPQMQRCLSAAGRYQYILRHRYSPS